MDKSTAFDVFAQLDPPLWLLTCQTGHQRGGLILTFVDQASIVPAAPRVIVGLARQHFTWPLVEAANSFVLHLLTEEHQDLVWRFGLQSGHDLDKLNGLPLAMTSTGNPRLTDITTWLDCRVETKMDTGDRTIYLAQVIDAGMTETVPPLTLKRLLELAPQEKKKELKTQMERDQKIDALAIEAFRKQ